MADNDRYPGRPEGRSSRKVSQDNMSHQKQYVNNERRRIDWTEIREWVIVALIVIIGALTTALFVHLHSKGVHVAR